MSKKVVDVDTVITGDCEGWVLTTYDDGTTDQRWSNDYEELYGEEEPEGWGERYKGPISKLKPAGDWYVDDPSDRD